MYNCCHHIYWLTRTHGLGYLRVDTSSHQFLQAGDAFLRSRSLLVLVHTPTIIIISLSRLAFLVPTLTIRIRKNQSRAEYSFIFLPCSNCGSKIDFTRQCIEYFELLLFKRGAVDAALIFASEEELDESLFWIIGNFLS